MTLTARDKKIAMLLLPVLVLAGYWFLILGPQRAEVGKLDEQLATAEAGRDEAQSNSSRLLASKANYAKDYATVVRLGKAIPSRLDIPSLLVQLDSAADGAKIDFDSVTAGERTAAAGAPDSATQSSDPSAGSSTPASKAGGAPAQTSGGKATEQANEAANTSGQANQESGADAGSTGSAAPSTAATGVAGLDTVPLSFTFEGSYFDLADFFHRIKRFVRVASQDKIAVKGRLMTIDGMSFKTTEFPTVTAEVTATVYLSPVTQGTTAGGTPSGPTATPSTQPAATGTQGSSAAGSTPAPASSPSDTAAGQ